MSNPPIRRIHLLGFVNEVRHIHENMPDRRFCFVLGAGASKPSGIPTAGELGKDWLKRLHIEAVGADPNNQDFAQWLSDANHGIPGLPRETSITHVAAAYPQIYNAKWGHDRAQGHAEIERLIEAAKPSYGYYALAEILASDDSTKPSRHNVVITPNFDNFPAETLGALGKKTATVFGHSDITDFARPTLRRPLIIKFHHQFLLAPQSNPIEVAHASEGYAKALTEIFRLYTPIVIGYGGNDGSLMGLLESLPPTSIPGGILWCWHRDDPPTARIEALVSKQAGTLIEIDDFDELMALLEAPFGQLSSPEKTSERAPLRPSPPTEKNKIPTAILKASTAGKFSPETTSGDLGQRRSLPKATPAASPLPASALLNALSAVDAAYETTNLQPNGSLPWSHWQVRINTTTDLDEKERLFEEALRETQNAPPMLGNYAIFLKNQRQDDARAEEYYLKAIAADPNDADTLGNYANFLCDHRQDFARAEAYYLKALAADPNHATNLGNYATFLCDQCIDDAQAEEYYLKAIAADPNDATNLGNYANFLRTQHQDDARAEEFYLKALTADPDHATTLANYAILLKNQRSDDARAEEYYLKAIAADPHHANTLGSYAVFLQTQRQDEARAQEYYRKALAADPNHASNLSNYAQFLIACGKFDQAAPFAKRAWEQLSERNDMGVGEVTFSRWLLATIAGRDGRSASGRLKTLLHVGYSRSPWNFDAMLAASFPKLTDLQAQLAGKLAAAILDESKLAELNAEPTWNLVQAIPLNAPWPDEPGTPAS